MFFYETKIPDVQYSQNAICVMLVLVYENWTVFIPWYKKPPQYSSHNYSRLHCLITLAQIAEGKKLVELAEVSIEEEDEAYFLDQEYSGLYNENVWECIECYLNLPDTEEIRP